VHQSVAGNHHHRKQHGFEYGVSYPHFSCDQKIKNPSTKIIPVGGPKRLYENVYSTGEMGVQKVAPSHFTGEEAMLRFKRAWGENFIPGGCGAQLNP
jgi:hypothetical protein